MIGQYQVVSLPAFKPYARFFEFFRHIAFCISKIFNLMSQSHHFLRQGKGIIFGPSRTFQMMIGN